MIPGADPPTRSADGWSCDSSSLQKVWPAPFSPAFLADLPVCFAVTQHLRPGGLQGKGDHSPPFQSKALALLVAEAVTGVHEGTLCSHGGWGISSLPHTFVFCPSYRKS